MEDVWPQQERLGVSGIVNILESYANRCSTPVPVLSDYNSMNPEENPEFLGSHFDRFDVSYCDEVCLHEESVGDVSLPALDFDGISF